jgi:hypothetical protein
MASSENGSARELTDLPHATDADETRDGRSSAESTVILREDG